MGRNKKVKEDAQVLPEQSKENPVTGAAGSDLSDRNSLLKAKLRKKYHLLRNEPLNFDDREELLAHVCLILGINRPQLDVVLTDL